MSNTMLFAEGLLSKQQVIEEFNIPPELEARLFWELKPRLGKLYWKKDVDPAMEKVLSTDRPSYREEGSPLDQEEARKVIAINAQNEPWTRIADGIERLIEVLKPKETPSVAPSIQVLTPHEAAKQMRVNPQTVMKWCRQGKMGAKAGRKWLITPDEVDRYLRGVLFTKGPKAVAG